MTRDGSCLVCLCSEKLFIRTVFILLARLGIQTEQLLHCTFPFRCSGFQTTPPRLMQRRFSVLTCLALSPPHLCTLCSNCSASKVSTFPPTPPLPQSLEHVILYSWTAFWDFESSFCAKASTTSTLKIFIQEPQAKPDPYPLFEIAKNINALAITTPHWHQCDT